MQRKGSNIFCSPCSSICPSYYVACYVFVFDARPFYCSPRNVEPRSKSHPPQQLGAKAKLQTFGDSRSITEIGRKSIQSRVTSVKTGATLESEPLQSKRKAKDAPRKVEYRSPTDDGTWIRAENISSNGVKRGRHLVAQGADGTKRSRQGRNPCC
jgi:hypothetical protein